MTPTEIRIRRNRDGFVRCLDHLFSDLTAFHESLIPVNDKGKPRWRLQDTPTYPQLIDLQQKFAALLGAVDCLMPVTARK